MSEARERIKRFTCQAEAALAITLKTGIPFSSEELDQRPPKPRASTVGDVQCTHPMETKTQAKRGSEPK